MDGSPPRRASGVVALTGGRSSGTSSQAPSGALLAPVEGLGTDGAPMGARRREANRLSTVRGDSPMSATSAERGSGLVPAMASLRTRTDGDDAMKTQTTRTSKPTQTTANADAQQEMTTMQTTQTTTTTPSYTPAIINTLSGTPLQTAYREVVGEEPNAKAPVN